MIKLCWLLIILLSVLPWVEYDCITFVSGITTVSPDGIAILTDGSTGFESTGNASKCVEEADVTRVVRGSWVANVGGPDVAEFVGGIVSGDGSVVRVWITFREEETIGKTFTVWRGVSVVRFPEVDGERGSAVVSNTVATQGWTTFRSKEKSIIEDLFLIFMGLFHSP